MRWEVRGFWEEQDPVGPQDSRIHRRGTLWGPQ